MKKGSRVEAKPRKDTFEGFLASLILSKNIPLVELAEKSGVSQPFLSTVLHGRRRLPDFSKENPSLKRLADALNLSFTEKCRLYALRLIVDVKNPIWNPEVVKALSRTQLKSSDELLQMLSNLKPTPTAWAHRKGIDGAFFAKLKKFVEDPQNNPPVLIASPSSKTHILVQSLPYSNEIKAEFLRFLIHHLAFEEFEQVLTNPACDPF